MSKRVDILIPEDQQEGTTLELQSWLKKVGDRVEKDEPVAELVTDKAVVELAAPASGILVEILAEVETQVEPDAVLGRIEASASDASSEASSGSEEATPVVPVAAAPVATPERGDRPPAHPAVLRFAAVHGIALDALEGSGRDGRVTRADVLAAAGVSPASPPSKPKAPRADASGMGPTRLVRHDPMRRAIAKHMAESVQVAPHVTAMFECDLSAVMKDRAARKAEFEAKGIKLTFTAYFLQAVAQAIRAVPEVNARWQDDGLEVFEHIHVGVGTALEDDGLVVPVVRDVQAQDLEATARVLTELTGRARSGKLSPADMKGSTFTVSNHGVMGSLMASPIIINQPESAILGIGKLEKRAKVISVDGEDRIEIRPMMYVTLTIDHRALDAFHTNRFLGTFVQTLEGWGA